MCGGRDQRRNCESGLHLPITVDCLSGVDQTSDITPEEEGRIMKSHETEGEGGAEIFFLTNLLLRGLCE